jgi:anti-sigma factor RsiW
MNCRSAESLFSAFLEDELNQKERRFLESHLMSCRRCSASMREFKTSIDLCGVLPTVDTSPHFEDDLMARIRSGEGLRPSVIEWLRGLVTIEHVRPFALAGAGASAVLVAFFVMHPMSGRDDSKIAVRPAPVSQAAPSTASNGGATIASSSAPEPVAPAATSGSAASSPGYAWADRSVRASSSIPDTTVPNPGSRYEDEYITDQFFLERGLDGGSNPTTVTPVSGRPSDDVYGTF